MSHPAPTDIVLIVGSAPDAVRCQAWDLRPVSRIVAINNAWRVRPDWDDLVFPDDFPPARLPVARHTTQRLVRSDAYVPANNRYGGVFYAGGTMAFTTAYWALAALRPRVMAFIGCDMVYRSGKPTHFYGAGTADPLRADPSLRNLEAKSARLRLLAAQQGCTCLRLSQGESRLRFPGVTVADLEAQTDTRPLPPSPLMQAALQREADLGYVVPSGLYWEVADGFDIDAIDALDALWLRAAEAQFGSDAADGPAPDQPRTAAVKPHKVAAGR